VITCPLLPSYDISNRYRDSPDNIVEEKFAPTKIEWWGVGVVICLERGADLYIAQLMPLPLTVSCFSKIQIGFTFWYWLLTGGAGKHRLICVMAIKRWLSLWWLYDI